MKVCLRADFSGGWLDVPRFAIPGAYVVNCAISPLVTIAGDCSVMVLDKPGGIVPHGSGLGSSAAWHILHGRDAIAEELAAGAGWQDPAILQQTGLCVWASGPTPELVVCEPGEWLRGLMALHWTGKSHCTADLANLPRDYSAIANAAVHAFKAVGSQDVEMLADAINMSAEQQYEEGMDELPTWGLAAKYCGAGHGGYALYLFGEPKQRDFAVKQKGMLAIEPYWKGSEPCPR